MGIFERIKNAIWGHGDATLTPTASAKPATPAAPSASSTPQPPLSTSGAGSPRPTSTTPVDIEAVLESKSKSAGQKLNWRTSIVDLMKLVDLDPSLANRKDLAKELGYSGDTADSAAMNIWLHKQVMKKLADSGGVVPASLRD